MFFGALCPLASMVSGSCDDIIGGASFVSPFGRLLVFYAFPRLWPLFFQEVSMAKRQVKSSRPTGYKLVPDATVASTV
jgi:hypothetical protein